jgi:MFS family permease
MTQVSKSLPPIPLSIWALGSVSFLMKISSVIVFSLTPIFVTEVLGGSSFVIGLLESFVEAITLFSRIFAGILSDLIHKRKNIIVFGYILALISRPILGLSVNIGGVFLGRALDRIGNGLDATPRDALVGDLAPPQIKGACYGLRESLSRAGSFSGSLFAIVLLWLVHSNYSLVYWLASIPTALALIVLLAFVKDPVSEEFQNKKAKKKIQFKDILKDIPHLPYTFWLILLLSGFFMLSNFSGAFLILRVKETGIDTHLIPLVMVIQNLATACTAYPVGHLSDKMGRRSMMALGILLVIFANLLLAMGGSIYIVLGGVLFWGAEMGITLSILAIFLADSCPKDFRGTGFGLFHLVNGICLILANTLSGWLWSEISPPFMFYTSAVIAACSSLVLPFIHNRTP